MTRKSDRDLLVENNTLTKEMHKVLFGNGQKGLKQEHDEMKGSLSTWKYIGTVIASSGLITAVISIIMHFRVT